MFCSACGQPVRDGARFCENCGAPLQAPGAITSASPKVQTTTRRTTRSKPVDPYKEQIAQIKLELKQLKLYLKQVKMKMSNTRSQYNETSAFVPYGGLHRVYKWFEDARLLGPQQQKQQLEQQILQLEQQLLGLQQAQAQWRAAQEQAR